MGFTDAVKVCFQKYATFTGRASRSEFWWFFLFQVIVNIVTGMVSNLLSLVVSLAFILPGIAVGTRRLHDIDKSGWLQLLWLVPILGWAVLIYWAVQPSGPTNQYGEPAAAEPPVPPAAVTGAQ